MLVEEILAKADFRMVGLIHEGWAEKIVMVILNLPGFGIS